MTMTFRGPRAKQGHSPSTPLLGVLLETETFMEKTYRRETNLGGGGSMIRAIWEGGKKVIYP